MGSIYEYFNKNPIFGLVQPGNPLYTPILGFFALTGLPLSGAQRPEQPGVPGDGARCARFSACAKRSMPAGWLFFRAVTSANSDADRQDRADGYN